MSVSLLSTLPIDIIQHELTSFLSFSDAISLRKTNHHFNGSFNYNHDPRLDNNYAIRLAAKHGNVDATKCLLKVEYVDPAFNDNEPLILAITENSSYPTVEYVNPAFNGNVQLSSSKGYAEIVSLLLNDPRVNPSDSDNAALLYAVNAGNVEIVRMLMDYGKFLF
jgi:ankyrin repeat protein